MMMKIESEQCLRRCVNVYLYRDRWPEAYRAVFATYGPLEAWDVSAVTDVSRLFAVETNRRLYLQAGGDPQCSSLPLPLTTEDLGAWRLPHVCSLEGLFAGQSLYLGRGLERWSENLTKVTSLRDTFANCRSLTGQTLAGWGSGLSSSSSLLMDMRATFFRCTRLEDRHLLGWDRAMHLVADLTGAFLGCVNIDGSAAAAWALHLRALRVTDDMFHGCTNLNDRTLAAFAPAMVRVESARRMFAGCTSLVDADWAAWAPWLSRLRHADFLFEDCAMLSSRGMAGWDLRSLETMDCMFRGCWLLCTHELRSWSFGAQLRSMRALFSECFTDDSDKVLAQWTLVPPEVLAGAYDHDSVAQARTDALQPLVLSPAPAVLGPELAKARARVRSKTRFAKIRAAAAAAAHDVQPYSSRRRHVAAAAVWCPEQPFF